MVPWLLPIWQATLGRPIARAELPDCCTPGAIRQPRRFSEAAPARSIRNSGLARTRYWEGRSGLSRSPPPREASFQGRNMLGPARVSLSVPAPVSIRVFPPTTEVELPPDVLLKPPPTQAPKVPVAVLVLPPLIELAAPLAWLCIPPLTESANGLLKVHESALGFDPDPVVFEQPPRIALQLEVAALNMPPVTEVMEPAAVLLPPPPTEAISPEAVFPLPPPTDEP